MSQTAARPVVAMRAGFSEFPGPFIDRPQLTLSSCATSRSSDVCGCGCGIGSSGIGKF